VGKYGRLIVDQDFRTDNPRIFAIGDVIGPPGTSHTSTAQLLIFR
jgi:pyruvate/2-oxoglutarate dehydrogenase complex dihydrolipoamide dehydrogenase (E3) component